MKFIGLTGTIGVGKTTVADAFKQLGACIIDADRLAKQAVLPRKPAWHQLKENFDPSFFNQDGSIRRKEFAIHIFKQKETVAVVNNIVHKYVHLAMQAEIEKIVTKNPSSTIIYDVPLLFETKLKKIFQKTILVYTSKQIVDQRLSAQTDVDMSLVELIRGHQLDQDEKSKLADFVLNNGGNKAELQKEISKIWNQINCLPKLNFDCSFKVKINEFISENN